jgi:hypothetical protein
MEMKLIRENGANIRPSDTTSYRSGVRVEAAAERLATSSRAIRSYAFAAALLNKCDSLGTRIFRVFWFGELFRELVERSL